MPAALKYTAPSPIWISLISSLTLISKTSSAAPHLIMTTADAMQAAPNKRKMVISFVRQSGYVSLALKNSKWLSFLLISSSPVLVSLSVVLRNIQSYTRQGHVLSTRIAIVYH